MNKEILHERFHTQLMLKYKIHEKVERKSAIKPQKLFCLLETFNEDKIGFDNEITLKLIIFHIC